MSVSIPLFEPELAALARQVGAGPKKVVLLLERAGWHPSLRLGVPERVFLHFWLTYAPLINHHFSSIEALEEAQAQRCVALQAQRALIRSITLFHWWPQRLHK